MVISKSEVFSADLIDPKDGEDENERESVGYMRWQGLRKNRYLY